MGYQCGGRRGGNLFLKDGSSIRSPFFKRGENDRPYGVSLFKEFLFIGPYVLGLPPDS